MLNILKIIRLKNHNKRFNVKLHFANDKSINYSTMCCTDYIVLVDK